MRAEGAVADGEVHDDVDEMAGLKLIKMHDVPRESHPSELLNLFGKRIGAEGHVSAAPMPHSLCAVVAARAPVSDKVLKRALGAAVAKAEARSRRVPTDDTDDIGERAQLGAVPFGGDEGLAARAPAPVPAPAPSASNA